MVLLTVILINVHTHTHTLNAVSKTNKQNKKWNWHKMHFTLGL